MEEYAYVLDYLPQGRTEDKVYKKTPLMIVVGEVEFKLLEVIPKSNVVVAVGERIYIGKSPEMREKVLSVKRRIAYRELTNAAMNELPYVLENIIKENEARFVGFFNDAQPINARLHSLELLPGLGNKTMWNIVDERKKKLFDSFGELTERVKTVHNPLRMISGRIVEELEDRSEKHKLFVAK
ncbi:DNA-binding protein [uncultured archaeon]|nr:DNA-binding protein [uncultured archaeon]